jgi:hypothetical protein
MSDETSGAAPAETVVGIAVPGEAIPDGAADYETTAREKGWKPKGEWESDPEDWIDAKEFIKRQPLFDKIKNLNKRQKELEKTINGMAQHYNISVAQAKQRALQELQAQKKEAIEVGDADRVAQIEKNMHSVQQTPSMPEHNPGLAPEIQDFVEANKEWFNKDQEMTNFAVSYNETYLKTHPGELDTSLAETMKAVKRAFPDKFLKANKGGQVAGSSSPSLGGKYDTKQLNSEQKLAYNQYVKVHKIMSHEDYFKSLEDAGFLGKGD